MITTRWQAAVATWLMWVGLEMQTRGRLLHEWASDRYWARNNHEPMATT